MKASEVRQKYLDFFTDKVRKHKEITPSKIVLENDPTTLFTSSGMQPLVPYLMGEKHPEGKRLVDSQPCIRTQDIDEVGDNRHTTFFEMLGNWSLGDYFKKEQLAWFYEFITEVLELPKEKIWVSVFEGNDSVPKDTESAEIWKSLGIPEDRIYFYDAKENWWSRSGTPEQMPAGEIGGPDSEVFYEFDSVKHDKKYGEECGPSCDCGRFLEIGNSVFMQYKKEEDGSLSPLPNKNVDFGGGLERLTAATNNDPDVFKIDIFKKIIDVIEDSSGMKYQGNEDAMRIVADHLRAAFMLAGQGVTPSNKQQGYIMRRLIRKAVYSLRYDLNAVPRNVLPAIATAVVNAYSDSYLKDVNSAKLDVVVGEEADKFDRTINKGMKILESKNTVDESVAFDLYQSEGFPFELTKEIMEEKGVKLSRYKFDEEMVKHQDLSRSSSAGKFKGGLADSSEETTRLHSATHLLHWSLREVLGNDVIQKGSNITAERLRFDFNYDEKLTDEQIKKVEDLISEKVDANLPIQFVVMDKEKAEKTGAIHAFGEKYGDKVKVYYMGEDLDSAFSKEFCGGPHVDNTGKVGHVTITKQKKIGAGLIRVYAEIK